MHKLSKMRRTTPITPSQPSASATSRRAADSDSEFEGEITPRRRAAPSAGVVVPDEEYYSGPEDDTIYFYKPTFADAIKLALARRVSDIYFDVEYDPAENLNKEIQTVLNTKVYPVGVQFHLLRYPGDVRADEKYSNFMRDVNVITDLVSSKTWKPQEGGKGIFLTDRLTRGVDLEMDVVKFGTRMETNRAVLEDMNKFMSQELKNFIDLAPHAHSDLSASTGTVSAHAAPTMGIFAHLADALYAAKGLVKGKRGVVWIDVSLITESPLTDNTQHLKDDGLLDMPHFWFTNKRRLISGAETMMRNYGYIKEGEDVVMQHEDGRMLWNTPTPALATEPQEVIVVISLHDPIGVLDLDIFKVNQVGARKIGYKIVYDSKNVAPAASGECHTCADLELRFAQLSERLELSEAYEKAQAEFIYWQFVEKKTQITDDKGKKHTIRSLMDLVQTPNMNPLKEDKGRAGLGIWIREDTIRILEAEGSFPRQV